MDLGPLLEDEIMGYRVAVVGATGAVGREMLQTLAERNFPADTIYALASTNQLAKKSLMVMTRF
jgi:aspartate-semialdehyde dehydrogenase